MMKKKITPKEEILKQVQNGRPTRAEWHFVLSPWIYFRVFNLRGLEDTPSMLPRKRQRQKRDSETRTRPDGQERSAEWQARDAETSSAWQRKGKRWDCHGHYVPLAKGKERIAQWRMCAMARKVRDDEKVQKLYPTEFMQKFLCIIAKQGKALRME